MTVWSRRNWHRLWFTHEGGWRISVSYFSQLLLLYSSGLTHLCMPCVVHLLGGCQNLNFGILARGQQWWHFSWRFSKSSMSPYSGPYCWCTSSCYFSSQWRGRLSICGSIGMSHGVSGKWLIRVKRLQKRTNSVNFQVCCGIPKSMISFAILMISQLEIADQEFVRVVK